MPNFASATLMGHLTRDVESRSVGEWKVSQFGLAVSRKVKGKDEVSFFDVKAWGHVGEFIAKHFSKGDAILVQGEIYTESWDDKQTGGRRSKMVVEASRATFAGGRKQERSASADEAPQQDVHAECEQRNQGRSLIPDDGDIPF